MHGARGGGDDLLSSFFLILMDILFYIFFDRNILSPSVIGTSMFVVSTLFAVFNKNNWEYSFSSVTVLVIISSLLVFATGEFLVRLCMYKRSQFREIKYKNNAPIDVSFTLILGIVFVFGLLLGNYYKETVKLAKAMGYGKESGALMLAYARMATTSRKDISVSRNLLANYSFIFIKAIAYVFSYIFLYNKIVFSKKTLFAIFITRVLVYSIYNPNNRKNGIYLFDL